jgi:hypothetical protein
MSDEPNTPAPEAGPVENAFEVLGLRNARYANVEGTAIDLEVNFRSLRWVPFSATVADLLPHAVEVWTKVQAGEAGEIAAYVAPPAPARLIAKTTIYRRSTDAEIDAFENFLDNVATARQRLMWRDAENGHVIVDEVLPLATALFGTTRAGELLA